MENIFSVLVRMLHLGYKVGIDRDLCPKLKPLVTSQSLLPPNYLDSGYIHQREYKLKAGFRPRLDHLLFVSKGEPWNNDHGQVINS